MKTNNKNRSLSMFLVCLPFALVLGACGSAGSEGSNDGVAANPESTETALSVRQCQPDLVCAQVVTCVDGKQYPTSCGPKNCDKPIGDCAVQCDPKLICQMVLSCVDGKQYPTSCGPKNCDKPIGVCPSTCDPNRVCQQVMTCVGGRLYPTSCGPDNCDRPTGFCPPKL